MSVGLGINWKNVQALPTLLPAGEQVFTLVGAKGDDAGRTIVSTSITGGEYNGKPFTYSYPNFFSQEWAQTEFKRLILALRDEPLEGESEVAFLNRVAGTKFGATIFHNTYKADDGTERTSAKIRLSSVKEAV